MNESGLNKKIFVFLKNVIINFSIFSVTVIIMFFILEHHFENYYNDTKNIPQTVMNLPIYQESEHRSWDHKPNTVAEHGFGTPTPKININSKGLRNDEVPDKKTKTRFLMLGDSFVFGMGVNQDKTFSARLQKYFGTKFQRVINAGIIGQTIDDAYMFLKYDGINYKPDYVIYNFFVANDVTELRRHEWTLDENSNILRVQDTDLKVDEENKLKPREDKTPQSYFLYFLSNRFEILQNKFGKKSPKNDALLTWPVFLPLDHPQQDENLGVYWNKFEKVLVEMKSFCDFHNIPLIVSVVPMDVQVSKKYWKKYPGMPFDDEAFEKKRPQKFIEIMADKHQIPIIDLLPLIQNEEEKQHMNFYFDNDPHLNEYGHRFVGAFIWRFIVDEFLK